jgi:transcriptional regulator with XRE-family HTH domain
MIRFRQQQGWSQRDLANALQVARSVVVRWETGTKPFPEERLPLLAQTTGQSEEGLRRLWTVPTPPPVDKVPSESLPPYPVKGTLQDVDAAMVAAAHMSPAVEDEMEYAFPRDSPLELAAALQFLRNGAILQFCRPVDLGCRLLVVEKETFRAAGHLWRHALMMVGKNRTLVAIPQVSVAVVSQSTERRMDYLLLWRGPRVQVWADLEIDSGYHTYTANSDARRAWGLGLPRLSFTADRIESKDFVPQVAQALTRLEKTKKPGPPPVGVLSTKFTPCEGTIAGT